MIYLPSIDYKQTKYKGLDIWSLWKLCTGSRDIDKKSVQNNEWCDYLLQILVILQFWEDSLFFGGER